MIMRRCQNLNFNSKKMKALIFLFVIGSVAFMVNGQSIEEEKCKWQEVTVMEYTSKLPDSTVIVKVEDMLLNRKINSLNELTEKELKTIKRRARKFKSCTVYVDLKQRTMDKSLNDWITDRHIFYYVTLEKL